MFEFKNGWETIKDSRLRKIMEMQEYYWNEIEPYTSGYGDDRILDMFERRFGVRVSHDIMMDIAYFEDF
jgi:hypothetical protein